jgi:anthranilate synthase component 1
MANVQYPVSMKLPKISLPKKPTYIKFAEDMDFYYLFQKIYSSYDEVFLLESLGEEGRLSRYSFIGYQPQHVIRGKKNILEIDGKEYRVDNPYFALRSIIPQDNLSRNFAGGLVGYLSYDAMTYFEPSLKLSHHEKFDSFVFGVFTDGFVLDKMTNELFYFHYGKNRIPELKEILSSKPVKKNPRITLLGDSLTQKQHAEVVKATKEEIVKGNTFQCQVGFKREFRIEGDILPLYEELRKVNPSPFMYCMKFGKTKIMGASPELLFKLSDRVMETYPLAGTVRRGKDAFEDIQLARKLLNDSKEQAEHNMLVDLHRNDIGRVAEFGTVKVKSLMDIKRFSHVQHISSEISGILKRGEDMFSALASNFPAGTLTGAPKIESMRIIESQEQFPRGPYGGAIGHFGFNGDCIFAIPIRTLFIHDAYAYTQASGGIVYDSTAENEYDEIQRKLAAISEVIMSFTT